MWHVPADAEALLQEKSKHHIHVDVLIKEADALRDDGDEAVQDELVIDLLSPWPTTGIHLWWQFVWVQMHVQASMLDYCAIITVKHDYECCSETNINLEKEELLLEE